MKLTKRKKIEIEYMGEKYIFYIEPITFESALELQKNTATMSEEEIGLKVLKETLCGWEDLYDEKGNEIQFSKDIVEEVIKALPAGVAMELINHILNTVANITQKRTDELGN